MHKTIVMELRNSDLIHMCVLCSRLCSISTEGHSTFYASKIITILSHTLAISNDWHVKGLLAVRVDK
jgi:hypothetical protein